MRAILLVGGSLTAFLVVWAVIASHVMGPGADLELLNVSYDPTRELWREINDHFIRQYMERHGVPLVIRQSHGGSSSQARSVMDGLEADVVTLALWPDTDAIRRRGLIADGWEDRLPNRSLPYYSTVVFVVRQGNPKGIRDWKDLVKENITIITPNPKTSGNGKLSFLAAWGAVLHQGGTEEDARRFVTELYRRVPVLDSGARGSTTTFLHKGIGDVQITWENEAHLEVKESRGTVEIVYPSVSFRAEPHVAVVDANVDRRGTRAAAEEYLQFLYTEEAQTIIARHFFRPFAKEVQKRFALQFPDIPMFGITAVARDWDDAHRKFFAEGGEFDRIYAQDR
ncbi:MAG: sulfate ABC transporter substrate-binding protein [Gemmatales bacterium]|nr:sulfate ABC transporter substrate-binding protein [Gemmatales bacterium]MDW8385901.1 sulfate ABC transporter substrate-binding protein [Gemmatales bacterium]